MIQYLDVCFILIILTGSPLQPGIPGKPFGPWIPGTP